MSRRQLSSLSWTSGLTADRVQVPAGFLACKTHIDGYVRFQRPLIANGAYDRAAIMTAAREAAEIHQQRYGSSRPEAMSVALKACWQIAKSARLRAAH